MSVFKTFSSEDLSSLRDIFIPSKAEQLAYGRILLNIDLLAEGNSAVNFTTMELEAIAEVLRDELEHDVLEEVNPQAQQLLTQVEALAKLKKEQHRLNLATPFNRRRKPKVYYSHGVKVTR